MADRTPPEATFLEHLAVIDRIIGAVARRHGLGGDDALEFASWIKLKLIEDDYAILRKFRGESAVGTYLNVVIATLARDYRVQRWGRWRPSAAARQRGPLAVRLEALIARHRYPFEQAAELLRTTGETTMSNRELATLLGELPVRSPLRPIEVGAEPLSYVQGSNSADVVIVAESIDLERQRTQRSLEKAMQSLATEDRVILKMRFWHDMSVAEIARALDIDQKPLYRKMEKLLRILRAQLASAGVTAEELRELLDETVPSNDTSATVNRGKRDHLTG